MQKLVGALALAAVAVDAASLHGRGSSVSGLSAVGAAETKVLGKFLKRRPAHPHDEEAMPPQEVQHEVETMMARVKRMGDASVTAEYADELSGVEEKLAEHAGAAGSFAGKELVDEIGTMRASLCVEQGFERHETSDCETFMRVVCSLQGSNSAAKPNSPQVSAENCHQFFLESKTEADASGRAESVSAQAAAATEDSASDVVSEAANESGNATAGFFGGKKGRALPDQGYGEYKDGRKVEHKDMNTSLENWLEEGEGRSIAAICKEFPDNEWCQLHTQDGTGDVSPAGNDPVHFMREPVPEPPAEPVNLGAEAEPVHFHSHVREAPRSGSARWVGSASLLLLSVVAALSA